MDDKKAEIQQTLESSEEYLSKEQFRLEEKKIDADTGILGKVFGCKENAPTYIAGLILVCFTIAFLINPEKQDFLTVITLTLGYIFGKST